MDQRTRLYKESLEQHEVDLLYEIMEITSNILEKNGIRYTIEGGTLLGAVRNGGLIPHDNDGDFDVLEIDLDRIRDLKEEFLKHDLIIIEVPGWGLQISHLHSPDLEPGLWNDGNGNFWTSKWPFLDLISIEYNEKEEKYMLAQDVAKNDYPNYYLTKEEWESPFEKIKFGYLNLNVINGKDNRHNYLDRNYPLWNEKIEMVMDHRKNVYFETSIVCDMNKNDFLHRKHTKYI
jgi:lipopolysaccharide cholinephosphotransferase